VLRFIGKLPATALDELSHAARHLAQEFGWPESAASWFTVSGVPPHSPPVQVRFAQGITLEVQPWVSPETVRAVYAFAQRKVRGHAHRSLSLKALNRFAFVHAARTKGKATWATLFEQWKRQVPRAERGGTWRRFQRDFARTEVALLRPTVAPAFKAQVTREAAERLAMQAKAVADLRLGPLVALGLGIEPERIKRIERRRGAKSGG